MSKLCSYLLQPLKYLLVYKSSLTFKYLIKLAMSRIMEPGNILFTCPLSRVLIFKHFSITLETFLQIEYSMKDSYIKQIKESSFSGEAGEGPMALPVWPSTVLKASLANTLAWTISSNQLGFLP